MDDKRAVTRSRALPNPAGLVIGTGVFVSIAGLACAAGAGAAAASGHPAAAGLGRIPIEYPVGLLASGIGLVALGRNRFGLAVLAALALAAIAAMGPLVTAAAALAQNTPGQVVWRVTSSLAGLIDPVPRPSMLATCVGVLFAARASMRGVRLRRVAVAAASALAASGAGVVGLLADVAPAAAAADSGAALMLGTIGFGASAAALLAFSAKAVIWRDHRWIRWATGPIVSFVFTSGVLLGVGLLHVQERRDAESWTAQARWLAATLDEIHRRQQEELTRIAADLNRIEDDDGQRWSEHLDAHVRPTEGLIALALLDRVGAVRWASAHSPWSGDRLRSLIRSDPVQRGIATAKTQGRSAATGLLDLGDDAQGFGSVFPLGVGAPTGFLIAVFRVSPLPLALNPGTAGAVDALRPRVTYRAPDSAAERTSAQHAGVAPLALQVGDGGWRLDVLPVARGALKADHVLASVVLAGSAVTAVLLFGVLRLWGLATSRSRILEAKNERLRRSSALLESAGEVAQVGGWELEVGSHTLRWTGQTLRMHGRRPGQTPSLEEAIQHFDEAARAEVRATIERAIETGEPFGFEHPLSTQDGRRIYVRVIGRARRRGVDIVALYGAIQDVTAARRTADELRASHARLQAIVETTVDGIVTIDEQSRIESFNPAAERMFGHRASDVIGRNVSILMPEPAASEHDGYVRRYLEGGAPRIIGIGREVQGRRADGSVFPLDLAVSEARLGERRLFVGLTRDITERKRIEANLVAAKELAEKASRAKSDFLSRMSHELRTPMNAILGFAQILELNPKEPLTRTQAEYVAQICRSGWQLLTMINEVLDLARIDNGQLQLRTEPVPLAKTVGECAALVGPLAETYGVSLTVCSDVLGRFAVTADADRLKHAVLNLLSNAVKYNRPAGRVTVTASLTDRQRVRLSVADTGRGLSPDQLARVFEPFERAGAERTTVEGAGIGLTIAKRLVEAMGGTIGVDSEAGVGSTFWIELDPAVGTENTEKDQGGPSFLTEDAPRSSAKTKRVLYVEDSEANVRLMRHMLASRPHIQLRSAGTAPAGIALACRERPDLIVVDIGLPGTDGFELKRQLDAHPLLAGVPIVALSGDADPEEAERGRAFGFADYLTKPVDVARFLRLIDTLLASGAR